MHSSELFEDLKKWEFVAAAAIIQTIILIHALSSLTQEFRSQQKFIDKIKDECAERATTLSKESSALDDNNNAVNEHPQSFSMAAEFYKVLISLCIRLMQSNHIQLFTLSGPFC